MDDLEVVDSESVDPVSGSAGCFLVRRKSAPSADGDFVATFSKNSDQGEDVIVFYGFLDQSTAVVLWSRAVTVLDLTKQSRLCSFELNCGYCSTGVLLGRRAIVAGTGDEVECYDLTDRTSPKVLPLEYIFCDSFKPVSGIEFAYAVLSKSRLVDIEERDGKLAFVIWSIVEQKVVQTIPFPFPDEFKATYCNRAGKDELMIGDYGDKHYLIDLNSGEWRSVPPDQEPVSGDGEDAPEDLSYFWRLVDLGGGRFVSLPKESIDGVWVHVWDVNAGVRIANFLVGVGPVDDVRQLSDDLVEVSTEGEKQVWSIRSSKQRFPDKQ